MLHELSKSPGRKKPGKRLGRGNGNGKGNYCGKGMKGQKARSGGNVPHWFEGGQTPLYRRLPKLRGFKRYFKLSPHIEVVNLRDIENCEYIKSESMITKQSLIDARLISRKATAAKLLGVGALSKKLTIDSEVMLSASAKMHIESAGGTIMSKE